MNRLFTMLASVTFIATANVASAQTQSTTTTSSPWRFGVTAGPAKPFGSENATNPMYKSPIDLGAANANDAGEGPNVGPEGGGTPMSRGGINDTLMGANVAATLNAAPPAAKSKSTKQADKSKANATAAPKP